MIAGGLVVMKSKASPLTPIPSLSMRKSGKLELGSDMDLPNFELRILDQSNDGNAVETSAPVVVVPVESLPTVNIEEFPDNNEATVDFPTPLPPTMETKDNCVSNSGMLGSSRNL